MSKRKIRRLYETDAMGIVDEELLDDVGLSLCLRCQSILAVSDARNGKVRCPGCRKGGRDTITERGRQRKDRRNQWLDTLQRMSDWHPKG